MHETGIVREVVRRLLRAASEAGAQSVSDVRVWLGALCQFSPEHFREHFNEETRGTAAACAQLHITVSHDLRDPNAQHVVLQSVEFEVPDEGSGSQ